MKCVIRGISVQVSTEPPFALKDISLSLRAGEVLAIVGESGSGKSSLLNALAGFLPIDRGAIILDDTTVSCATYNLPPLKRNVGYIFQDRNLLPHLTLGENLTLGMDKQDKQKRDKDIQNLIRSLKLEHVITKYPSEASGGQQQRIALARALLHDKKLLLFDEPFSGLDTQRTASLAVSIRETTQKYGKISIFVTHQIEEAFLIADRIAIMQEGKLLQVGEVDTLYHFPQSIEIARLLGPINIIEGVCSSFKRAKTPYGDVEVRSHQKLAKGQKLHILTRPDDWSISAAQKPNATIVGIVPSGMYKRIDVRYKKACISVQVDHHSVFHKGQQVNLSLNQHHSYSVYPVIKV